MKHRIFLNILIVSIVTMLLTSTAFTVISFNNQSKSFQNDLKREARYISLNIDEDYESYLKSLKNIISDRITLISPDGTVLFDSTVDYQSLENHSKRPEFIDAQNEGAGQITRLSDTLSEQTSYYALKLDNGNVIRLAYTSNSIYKSLIGNIPFLLLMIIPILILCIIIAKFQTRLIIDPINKIDISHPENNNVYEEISPLLTRIVKQNESINEYVNTLNKNKIEFDTITSNMNEGLIILDHSSVVISINKSAIDILGLPVKDYSGYNVMSLNRTQSFIDSVEDAKEGNSNEFYLKSKNKSYLFISSPVKDKDATIAVVLIMVDISEKEERESLRREFSANVSHELKTPLTSISGYAEIMKNGLVKPADIERFSDKIYQESQRLINLIEDIIKISKLDEKDVGIVKEPVSVYGICESVKSRLVSVADRHNISITLSGTTGEIFGVRHILDEIVFNLCDNAIKYNKENGNVDIKVDENTEQVTLTVRDTGIGIPDESKDRVFERFYRVDKSHSKATGGTGLGLSIVKHGAMFHNAQIKLDSKENEGTTIAIIFPKEIPYE